MKYYISNTPIRLREFGRSIQSMIEHATQIPDRQARTRAAEQIVRTILQLHPHLRETNDVKKYVWESVFVMSDFELEVDAPYAPPAKTPFTHNKTKIGYKQKMPRYAQYGRNVELALQEAAQMPEGSHQRWDTIMKVADFMRQCLVELEKEAYLEKTISDHIYELSGKKIAVHPDDLRVELPPLDSTAPPLPKDNKSRNQRNFKNFKKEKNPTPMNGNNAAAANTLGGGTKKKNFKKRR